MHLICISWNLTAQDSGSQTVCIFKKKTTEKEVNLTKLLKAQKLERGNENSFNTWNCYSHFSTMCFQANDGLIFKSTGQPEYDFLCHKKKGQHFSLWPVRISHYNLCSKYLYPMLEKTKSHNFCTSSWFDSMIKL